MKNKNTEVAELVIEDVAEGDSNVSDSVIGIDLTNISEVTEDRPEFGNMTNETIKQWLEDNPFTPIDEVIAGFTVKCWNMSRSFNVSPQHMQDLIENNNL